MTSNGPCPGLCRWCRKWEEWSSLPAVKNNRVYAIDAGAYTSRSGPRLVVGLEIMAEMIHPELFTGLIPESGAVRLFGA